jgi:hypothetical protein
LGYRVHVDRCIHVSSPYCEINGNETKNQVRIKNIRLSINLKIMVIKLTLLKFI